MSQLGYKIQISQEEITPDVYFELGKTEALLYIGSKKDRQRKSPSPHPPPKKESKCSKQILKDSNHSVWLHHKAPQLFPSNFPFYSIDSNEVGTHSA